MQRHTAGHPNQLAVVEGYYAHREHESRIETPVLRSSALFYALESDDTHTDILLFNYWLPKLGIDGLTMAATLRTAEGKTVHTESSLIDFDGAKTLSVKDLLHRANLLPAFEGSIEIEILSTDDLKVPYPAIVVRYFGDKWHTMAHSYSRILSESSGDNRDRISALQKTAEGNWTVYPDSDIHSFMVIHNGHQAVPEHDLRLILTNQHGERLITTLENTTYAPFETRVIYPNTLMDVAGHLGDSFGCMEVQTLVSGVFTRLLWGLRRASDGALSVDHSNFSSTSEVAEDDCLLVSKAGTAKPLGYVVPSFGEGKWNCYADIYPTYPDRNYTANLRARTADGSEIAQTNVSIGTTENPSIVRIGISDMIGANPPFGSVDFSITHEIRVPRRFHMGISYQYDGGLPATLISGPNPYTWEGNTHSWFPVISWSDIRSYIFVSNQIMDPTKQTDVTYDLALYNSNGDEPLHTSINLTAGATIACSLEEILPSITEYLGGKEGWVYLESDRPCTGLVFYAIVMGENSLAVDHSF